MQTLLWHVFTRTPKFASRKHVMNTGSGRSKWQSRPGQQSRLNDRVDGARWRQAQQWCQQCRQETARAGWSQSECHLQWGQNYLHSCNTSIHVYCSMTTQPRSGLTEHRGTLALAAVMGVKWLLNLDCRRAQRRSRQEPVGANKSRSGKVGWSQQEPV